MNIVGCSSVFSYDATKVLPYNRTEQTALGNTKLNTAADIAPYLEVLADELSDCFIAPNIIDNNATTKYIAFGYSKPAGYIFLLPME